MGPVHAQAGYHARLFAFQLLMQRAKVEFGVWGRVHTARRKFEEAYSCWRYFREEQQSATETTSGAAAQ